MDSTNENESFCICFFATHLFVARIFFSIQFFISFSRLFFFSFIFSQFPIPPFFGIPRRLTGNGEKYCIADDYIAEDARIAGYLEKSSTLGDGANLLWQVTDDFCLPPGNLTGWFYNATRLYQPGLSPGGGWVATAKITGTDTVLYTSIGLGYDEPRPNPDQIGNFSFELPNAGIPISLNSNGAKWVKVKVIVSTTATGLELASTSTTAAVNITDDVNTPNFNEIYFDATFEATGTLSFTLDSADDDVDDEDSTYTLKVYVEEVRIEEEKK